MSIFYLCYVLILWLIVGLASNATEKFGQSYLAFLRPPLPILTWYFGLISSVLLLGIGAIVKYHCHSSADLFCLPLVNTESWDAWYVRCWLAADLYQVRIGSDRRFGCREFVVPLRLEAHSSSRRV